MLNKLRDKIIKKISKKSNTDEYIKYAPSESVVRLNMSTRPAYAYCLYHAVKLAKKLNYKSISAIEFGVAGGNGLYFLDLFADQLSKEFDIEIEIYGFDLGGGLPKPKDYKDLPYIFKEGLWTFILGWQYVALGVLIVVIVIYFPEGLMGWLREKFPERFGEAIDEKDRKASVELK